MKFIPVKVAWDVNTFIFYLAVILICYFIAVAGRKTVVVSGVSFKCRQELYLILIAAVLVFVKGFGTTGRDLRGGYFINFLSATSLKQFRDQSVEIGYRILNVFIRTFTDEYWVFILICSLITILPVIHMLKKYADRIDLPVSVLLYVTCYFINGFSPLRQAMAASIAFYGFDAMIERRYGTAIFWILLASSFHISAIVFIVPIFITMAKLTNRKLIGVCLFCLFILIWVERQSLTLFFAGENSRYEIYEAHSTVSFGFEQLIYYIPLFLVFAIGRKMDTDKHFELLSLIYLSMGFFFGICSYIFPAFGRFDISFVPYIIIIPYYCMLIKKRFPGYRFVFNLAIIVYCLARFVIFIIGYYGSQDLMPYTNLFGWVI